MAQAGIRFALVELTRKYAHMYSAQVATVYLGLTSKNKQPVDVWHTGSMSLVGGIGAHI